MDVKGKKIFVGLSGGVDSAVSAALLKKAGAEVTGVFIKGWYPDGMSCTWAEDRRDAMRVAAHLHIPFRTLDASADYKKYVIDYLISEYREGRTPNPDVMCNKEIKFGVFYRYAMSSGANAIATGHYRSGEKDQSYFLWAVPKDIFDVVVFPVGNMEKTEVRKLAKKFKLPVSEKKDSQGVCFLGSVSVKEFLQRELGTDNPALLYTVGQKFNGGYITEKNIDKKEIKVSKTRESNISEIVFANANWHGIPEEVNNAQMRYRGPHCPGHVDGNKFIGNSIFPEIYAEGQSIVFYNDDKLIGGGIISS